MTSSTLAASRVTVLSSSFGPTSMSLLCMPLDATDEFAAFFDGVFTLQG